MRVLVTGANGHLGFNLVSALIDAGHSVRASVRSVTDTSKTARLRTFPGVDIVEAELSRSDQMKAAMDGVELVFHAAAVYAYVTTGRTQEIFESSVKGAEMVVQCAADTGVRKVVLTSSVVTLPLTLPGAPPVDESQWTNDLRVPYVRAKTEGEKTAWRVAGERNVNLVTILPGAILGPGFERNTPSIDLVEAMVLGGMRMAAPDTNFPLVDVRDVAAAHLLAAEQDCSGRFIVCNDVLPSFRDMLQVLHALDPAVPLPLLTLPDFLVPLMPMFDRLNHRMLHSPRTVSAELMGMLKGKRWNASNRRIKETLGWQQTVPMRKCLADTLAALRQRQHAGSAALHPA